MRLGKGCPQNTGRTSTHTSRKAYRYCCLPGSERYELPCNCTEPISTTDHIIDHSRSPNSLQPRQSSKGDVGRINEDIDARTGKSGERIPTIGTYVMPKGKGHRLLKLQLLTIPCICRIRGCGPQGTQHFILDPISRVGENVSAYTTELAPKGLVVFGGIDRGCFLCNPIGKLYLIFKRV